MNIEEGFEIVQCANKLELRESFKGYQKDTSPNGDVYRATGRDNDVTLSIENRRFTDIMENGICKNA